MSAFPKCEHGIGDPMGFETCDKCRISELTAKIERLRKERNQWTRRAAFNRSVALCGESWTQNAEDQAAEGDV